MTMIRINLIAEKKPGGSTKVAKKTTGGANELQENLLLIIGVALAIVVVAFMWNQITNSLREEQAYNAKLKAEYAQYSKYQDEKDQLDLEKELLNEKIKKISELKDRREGPVKLLEDVANVLPDSVWLISVSQAYDQTLAQATRSEGKVLSPGKNLGEQDLIQIVGKAKTPDAVTTFANKILQISDRYQNTELNNYETTTLDDGKKEISFTLFFKVRKSAPADSGENSGG